MKRFYRCSPSSNYQRPPRRRVTSLIKWDSSCNAHPFWGIPRMKVKEDVPNCELVYHATTVVVTTASGPGGADPATLTYQVSIPYIVNTRMMKVGEKIIITQSNSAAKKPKVQKETMWADDVAQAERKRRKTKKNA